ncbi:MAG: helix-turn-helix domain-containing protein [Leptolyngbya sp. SIO1E4]|nr:helix-turn-helix domain-containing protein [Leptolyngbya sp. SIO1E4]
MKKQSPDINQLHQEQLIHIGQLLREMRNEYALSYEDLAKKTLIRPSLLEAIETANVDQLPEPVYTRGLIRRYGESLGLDGETLASQYFTPPNSQKPHAFWRVSFAPQLRPMHLYVIYVFLIAIAISALSYTLKQTTYRTSTLPILSGESAEEAMMPEEGPRADAENSDTPDAGALPAAVANAPIRVAVEMQGQSWLRITSDGSVAFEGILKAGDSQIWTAKEQLKVRAGNAGGVVISFNEGTSKVLGQPGVVTEITYPPEDTAQLTAQP